MTWTRLIAVVAIFFVASSAFAAPPNIVFLISDDQSSFSLGCYGDAVRTPNLDKLAAEGVRFANHFVASPQCSPSRSAVLTGKSPHRTNTSRLHAPLPNDVSTIIDELKAAGYFTGGYRKHHLGPGLRDRFDFYANDKNWAAFFERRPADKPFFLWVGFNDPHRDYTPGAANPPHDPATVKVPPFLPDTPDVRKDLALYYDHITRLDADAGDVLALLDKHGLTENTLVVFFSDNGMPFPGAKGTLYDPGTRVPLIVRWPGGKATGGRVSDVLVTTYDLTPTVRDIAGIPAKANEPEGGVSLRALLAGDATGVHDAVFVERNWHDTFDPMRCVRTERFKLIYNCRPEIAYKPITDLSRSPTWTSIKSLHAEGKLPADMDRRFFAAPRPTFELYDLAADPNELRNLADDPAHDVTRRELTDRLSKWMDATNDFLPPPAAAARADKLYETGKPTVD